MLKSNLKHLNRDVTALVKDAKALFNRAAALTGDQADEARQSAMQLLDTALERAREAQESTLSAGKKIAASTDHYVSENPWRTVTAAGALGLLLGVILGRK
jgi:ElaB/YqjD/DUF883 family membrane-anchored ribosome-binding protein